MHHFSYIYITIIFDYEMYIEKSIIEISPSKFILLTLNIHRLKITRLKINVYLTLRICIIYFLIFILRINNLI